MVSIIIPTHHGADLTNVLKFINQSTYTDYEIIVVDEGLERSAQRNIGIDRAKGEYLLFLDSDQCVTEQLIGECIYLMLNGYDAIYIPEIIVTKGLFGKIRDFEREFYTGTAIDVVRFVRAKNCPRFDEEMSGPEDSDWDRRVPGRRKTCKNYVFHHDQVELIRYCQKKAYYTKSMVKFAKKWKEDKILDLKYRCWTVFVEDRKWKKIFEHPFLAIGVFFLLIIRGIIYGVKK